MYLVVVEKSKLIRLVASLQRVHKSQFNLKLYCWTDQLQNYHYIVRTQHVVNQIIQNT